jgi:hypothetical protein
MFVLDLFGWEKWGEGDFNGGGGEGKGGKIFQ